MPPAIIAAGIMAGGSIAGSALAGRNERKAQKGMAAQQAGLANEMSGFARQQHSMAEPALSKAMQYYMKLASGDRGAIQSQLAPDIAGVTDVYRGAERGLGRSAAGPQRDMAFAELNRQKAGQLGMMPFQARQNAMSNLSGMGTDRLQAALQAYGGASSALTGASNQYGNLAASAATRGQQYGQIGASFGNIVIPWLMGRGSSGGAGVSGLPGGTNRPL